MFSMEKYAKIARQAVAEGAVLVKNDNAVLPLQKGCRVASFGRSQWNYFKSGTGSGGLVNVAYQISVLDAMKSCEDLVLNETVLGVYEDWIKDNPFDKGPGWAMEPWSQKEMPLDEEMVKAAAQESELAVITIARLAGEDKDNSATEGSYLLTEGEEQMLETVCRIFDKTVVILNVGNVIDMKWVKKYNPSAVLYVWQGGQEGGNGVLDVLTGAVSPSGKLTDTIPWDIQDNPSTANFGDPDRNIYVEDIYVGYRYFETFAKDKVFYPFGFGLSYTTFAMKTTDFAWDGENVTVSVEVTNTGSVAGKEVVQLYVQAPQGKLGKASRVLCGFAKTQVLQPGESEVLTITCGKYYLASYDDSGVSGYLSAYVLEAGTYTFYAGSDVRCEMQAGAFTLEDTVLVEQLSPALSPVTPFERMRAVETEDGLKVGYEPAPQRSYDLWERICSDRPAEIPFTGDKGYKLADVKNGTVTMEDFVAQLPAEQLAALLRSEGMCSPKVTPGVAGAMGGLSETLKHFGIPAACCADGPSGIRMDVGTEAFSMPNGTCLACTFNEALSEELFNMTGLELRKNRIETLLGPGMNLRRSPLNGRNFEYFSEDPFLTGKIGAAQLKGMHRHNVTGTMKHFICNNQEYRRSFADAVASERALREMYLRGYEIACKEADAYSIMTMYGPVNGLWAASNYDLLTHILRKEWGYTGIVMTDWWAKGNEEGEEGSRQEVAAMVRSQNDLYMVVNDAENNSNGDNIMEALGTDRMTLGEMQRNVINVLRFLMNSPAMERLMGCEEESYAKLNELAGLSIQAEDCIPIDVEDEGIIPASLLNTETGGKNHFLLRFNKGAGLYKVTLRMRSMNYSELAQMPVTIFYNSKLIDTVTIKGIEIEWREKVIDLGFFNGLGATLSFVFGQNGAEVEDIVVTRMELPR